VRKKIANKNLIFVVFLTLFLGGVLGFFQSPVFASSTDGTIDSTYKYAWGENTGWINFGCSNCNVHIADSGLTGYAWSENYGWINLNPATSGVKNNNEGTLSGYAWGESLGWINFSGVTINSSGEFAGTASGDNTGQISFNCTNCKTKTDWRPLSARPVSTPSGGGMPSEWFNPPTPPVEGFGILINQNAGYANSPTVALIFRGGLNTERMAISNFSDFRDAGQEIYAPTKIWNLCQGLTSCPEGEYTVYAKFYTPWGTASEIISDSIIYQKSLTAGILEIIKKIPEFFKPKPPEVKPPEIPLEELLPKEAPLSLKSKWLLLDPKAIGRLVFAPLPKDIRVLAQKFPQLEKTFKEVGITRMTELEKLKTTELILPGLTETAGLPTIKIESGKFALPQGIPVVKLSPKIKQKLPTEIVFARTGGELIDFNITLTINEKGNPQQKISTISGKPLQLVIKPDKPVKNIKGYVVFKSKNPQPTSLQIPFNQLAASLIFANPVFAQQQEKPVRVEEKLVLLEFEYTDPDGDGIYTAEISAPTVEGEYEIITVMNFEDPELGLKEIRLTTVVDPEGYVYEKKGDKETRIPGAIVSLFGLNSEIKQYELWPAKEYQQENPQTTDVRGTYSFLVPEGYYYLKVETPGYLVYDGKPFQVKEGSGIHINIELKTKYWWLKVIDWKIILLVLVIVLLLYNFYRDKIRERLLRQSKNL